MIVQALLISGSIWLGKRIYEELTTSLQATGASQSLTRASQEETLSQREQESCRNLALSGSGLALAIGGAVSAPILSLLSAPVVGYSCLPLLRDGLRELRDEQRVNYGLLVTLMVGGSLVAKYFVLTAVGSVVYFGSEVMLAMTRRRARRTLEGMAEECSGVAWVKSGDVEISVPLVELQPGDIVVVRAGEPIPVDGMVVGGAGGVDQSIVTGESVAAEKAVGDSVFAATLLLHGTLDIRVEQAGAQTLVGRVGDMLRRMDSFESTVEHECAELAEASVAPTLALSAVGWAIRGPMGGLTTSSANFTDVNRIASPVSMLNYLRVTADAGIHVKDGRSLELLGDVDTLVFDKTGTLTVDRLSVVQVQTVDGFGCDNLLAIAAAAEERQQHPIAVAIRAEARESDLKIPAGITETSCVGNGIVARVENCRVLVGSQRHLVQAGITIPDGVNDQSITALSAGQTVVHVARDGRWVGLITLQSSVRPEVAAMIATFQADGYRTAILSGDHEGPTRRLAESLGVDMWRAGVLPEEKVKFIKELQNQGRSVCFVGDGVNDGLALKAAHVSVSLNGASMVATDSAQIVLRQDSLEKLRLLFDLSKRYRADQKLMQRTMLTTSTLSAGGALLLGLPLGQIYMMYFATIAAEGAIAASPVWRRLNPDGPPDGD